MLSSDASISPMIGGETTTMVNGWASLRPGVPLSVTRTVTKFVLDAFSVVGVQVNRQLVGLISAPAGAPGSRLKVRRLGGIYDSVATLVLMGVTTTQAS